MPALPQDLSGLVSDRPVPLLDGSYVVEWLPSSPIPAGCTKTYTQEEMAAYIASFPNPRNQ